MGGNEKGNVIGNSQCHSAHLYRQRRHVDAIQQSVTSLAPRTLYPPQPPPLPSSFISPLHRRSKSLIHRKRAEDGLRTKYPGNAIKHSLGCCTSLTEKTANMHSTLLVQI